MPIVKLKNRMNVVLNKGYKKVALSGNKNKYTPTIKIKVFEYFYYLIFYIFVNYFNIQFQK